MLALPEYSLSTLDVIHRMDALDFLRALASDSVHCVITSPPYYGLRDYQVAGQIGLEDSPQAYIARLVAVFREVRRVLRADGTCWVNMGDSYAGMKGQSSQAWSTSHTERETLQKTHHQIAGKGQTRALDDTRALRAEGFKPKDLLMMPARLAIALQDDGWWLRSEIIWCKPNPMPESVTDRPTKAHEMVYLLAKSARYWSDFDAIRQAFADATVPRLLRAVSDQHKWTEGADGQSSHTMSQPRPNRSKYADTDYGGDGSKLRGHSGYLDADGEPLVNPLGANIRSVWTIPTESFHGAHYATFPTELVRRCLLAGCPAKCCPVCGAGWVREVEVGDSSWEARKVAGHVGGIGGSIKLQKANGASYDFDNRAGGFGTPASRRTLGFRPSCHCHAADTRPGVVLDPFMGSGTTALVARSLGRHFLGCDLSAEYVALARERLRQPYTLPMVDLFA